MKKIISVIIGIMIIALPLAAEGRYALIIGNSKYEASPLVNPENDAKAMEEALIKLGFDVTPVYNGTNRQMVKALNQFKSKLKPGDTGLFYYAGHGIQVDGQNFLIPVDAVLESEEDIEFETLQLNRVVRTIENSGAATNIVILDSCRDNPFKSATRSLSRGLSMVDTAQGSIVIYATAPGEVAQDGTEDNGLFTSVLLKHMIEPGLEVNRMLTRVRMEVSDLTQGKQVPYASVSLLDDFYFNVEGLDLTSLASMQTGKFVLPPVPDGVLVTLDGVPYNDQLEQRGEFLVSRSISAGEHTIAFQGEYIPESTRLEINVKQRETINTNVKFPEFGRLNLVLPTTPVNYNLTNPDVEMPDVSTEMLLVPGTYLLTAAYKNDPIEDNYSEQILIKPYETVTRNLQGLEYSNTFKIDNLQIQRSALAAENEDLISSRKIKKAVGWTSIGVGALLGAGSAASWYLGTQAYDEYDGTLLTPESEIAREDIELYSSLFLGTLGGSLLGFITGTIFNVTAPDNSDIEAQLKEFDRQIIELSVEGN